MWRAKALHCFSEEFQSCFTVPAFGNVAFQHFPFVIHSPPKVVRFAIDLHKDFARCHCQFEYERIRLTLFLRISAANIRPNLFHQNRTVSWLISIPRSCKRSSTFLSDKGNRTYIITARRKISGLVLKCLNGECFFITAGYATALPASSRFPLTMQVCVLR